MCVCETVKERAHSPSLEVVTELRTRETATACSTCIIYVVCVRAAMHMHLRANVCACVFVCVFQYELKSSYVCDRACVYVCSSWHVVCVRVCACVSCAHLVNLSKALPER